jgi:hypothetical protein
MSTRPPELILADNLSHGWGKAFIKVMEATPRTLSPMMLSIGFANGHVAEDDRIRSGIDEALARKPRKYVSATSAMMIFPHDQWERRGRPPRDQFFRWYLELFLPRLKARNRLNRTGTYFERMIAYRGTKRPRRARDPEVVVKNQLDHIISIWHRDRARGTRPRQSALQAACFDPAKDHTGQKLRGFPCLQQVSFGYDDDGGLAVEAYYPTQYIFDRAYGNYLGLAHLGQFMAHELGLRLTRLNCFVAHPELGNGVTKEELRLLEATVRARV